MYEFDCVRAHDVEEALAALEKYGDEAAVIAGGTDLHVLMRAAARRPRVVVAVAGIPGLRVLGKTGGRVQLGAALTHAEIAADSRLGSFRALQAAASAVGSPQIRNVGTAGGNIANASPAADLFPPLLVLDARVSISSLRGRREVPLAEFLRAPGQSAIGPGELITGLSFDEPKDEFRSGFAKIGLRNAVAISVANGAILATARDGRFAEVRIACGAVAPKPIRMLKTEALLSGKSLTPELVREAQETASAECDPITDIRATKTYRRHVAGILVARLVEAAWQSLVPGAAD